MRHASCWIIGWIAVFAAPAASAAGGSFPLGLDYSRQIAPGTLRAASIMAAAVDAAGAVYLIGADDASRLPATTVLGSTPYPASFVVKLTPGGDQVVYLTILGFRPNALAVDPAGNVYLAAQNQVAKLNAAGTALVYTATIGEGLLVSALAVDATGHAYVTGWTSTTPLRTTSGAFQQTASNSSSHAFVVKLNPAGTAFDYASYVAGSSVDLANGIAVDGSGAALIRGITQSTDFPVTPGAYRTTGVAGLNGAPFLARLAPDGSRLVYATFTGGAGELALAVAADPAGNAVIAQQSGDGSVSLLRFNPQGASAARSQPLPKVNLGLRGEALAMDAAGTAYLTGFATSANYPVKNSLAECGSVFLSAFDPAGNLLQSSYMGGAPGAFSPAAAIALALGPDSAVYVAAPAGASGERMMLTRLSPNTPPRPVAVACVGNAGSFDPSAVAPGEIVSLFGQGLGPPQGVQPEVDLKSGFPTRLAGVQVTFDGTPAPLLYVQDGQINAIAPWRLAPGQSTKICVTYNSAAADCLQRPVVRAAPGVFTVDGTHAAAVNQDGTINSAANPAQPGAIVSIFATGLGPLNPTPPDGAILEMPLPTDVLPAMAAAIVGGIAFSLVPIQPQYAGPAPFQVAGVSQINLPASSSPMLLVVGPDFYTGSMQSRSFRVYTRAVATPQKFF